MKSLVFAIFDSKANAYLQPFHMPTEGMAKRVFMDCVRDPNHNFGRHPADYTLFRLGVFDDGDGRYDLLSGNQVVCNGIELVARDDFDIQKQQGLSLNGGGVRGSLPESGKSLHE